MKETLVTPWTSFVNYYFAQVIVIGGSLAFYGVMAFMPRIPCNIEDGSNPTGIMNICFIVGFSLHAVNFVIATFVEPILRAKLRKEQYETGQSSETQSLFVFGFIVEHSFRGLFVLFSLFQIMTVGSPGVKYCSTETDHLKLEAEWTMMLAIS